MNNTIALSVDNIINTILAQTALRHHLRADRPPLLNRSHSAALAQLARNEASAIAARMNALTDTSDADIITFTVECIPAVCSTLCDLLHTALTSALLSSAYAGTDPDVSRHYRSLSSSASDTICTLTASRPASITPSLF